MNDGKVNAEAPENGMPGPGGEGKLIGSYTIETSLRVPAEGVAYHEPTGVEISSAVTAALNSHFGVTATARVKRTDR